MKQIINGKRYDTETSGTVKVAEWDNGLSCQDFRHCAETLYRTARGARFIHGDGGPMTGWSRSAGNMTTGSEGIVPVSAKEARGWLEAHEFAAEIEAFFSSEIEDA